MNTNTNTNTIARFYSLAAAESAFTKLLSGKSPDYRMGFPGAIDAPRFGVFEIEYFDTREVSDYEFPEVVVSYESSGEDGFRLIQKGAKESRVLIEWGWCHDQNTFWYD